MVKYLLIVGMFLPNGEIQPRYDLFTPIAYESMHACEETANHPAVLSTYAELVSPDKMVIWCEKINKK